MSTVAYNDYVISASLQAGWINADQEQMVREFLTRSPEVAALDFMVEQELLPSERAQTLKDLISQAQSQHAENGHSKAGASSEKPAEGSSSGVEVTQAVSAPAGSLLEYLHQAKEMGASDVHLGPEAPPMIRLNGTLRAMSHDVISPDDAERLGRESLSKEQEKRVEEIGSVDFCYDAGDGNRFRASVVRQRRGWESVYRIIDTRVRSMQELGLPPVLYEMVKYHNGIILVTGAVGSGKTTTLASMVDQINTERTDHIITLEDPIEYVFQPKSCHITQREIRSHTESFSRALRGALRQDPDIIMIGEMRDLETTSLAITASETGHLVLATLHTSTAARTMQRLLDVFPVEQQAQIRTMVSESLRGVVCQQLVPRADGQGRVLALEIMTSTPAIANLIREGQTVMLPGVMQTGKKQGMKLMDDSLLELYQQGFISADEGMARAVNPKLFAATVAAGAV